MMVNDSLKSFLGSLGDPSRDKMAGTAYGVAFLSDFELMNAYRGAWLPRKVVDIPALDSVRAWRGWNADPKDIEKIEAEEKRLKLRVKVWQAKIKARLFGGSAIYIGTGDSDLTQPLNINAMGRDGIKFLTVLSRVECQAGNIENDPLSEYFGKPRFYRTSQTLDHIHPSRFVIMQGLPHPEPRYNMLAGVGWGDSILLPVMNALKDVDASARNAANLLFEANVDTFGVPDLLASMTQPGYEARLLSRFSLAAANKGINRSLIMDKDEVYQRHAISLTGVPDLLSSLMTIAAGAADIPATRLFGMSPAGMSSTGESDLRNYYDRLSSVQELEMTPELQLLDDCVLRSALGTNPGGVYYNWRSLWQLGEKERAEIVKLYTDSASVLASTGIVELQPLGEAVVNQFAEIGAFPGMEAAANPEKPEPVAFDDPDDVTTTDAAPRTLYISRKVTNAAEIITWAKSQGFDPVPASELHVTIIHSREPVDWIKVGETYEEKMTIGAGGPRLVEIFGDGSIVLQFSSRSLAWRNEEIREAGASSDFQEYQPHVTFAKFEGMPPNLMGVVPYVGRIELGPEIFSEIRA